MTPFASALVCTASHGKWICRPPILTALAVGVVLVTFLVLLMIIALAALRAAAR